MTKKKKDNYVFREVLHKGLTQEIKYRNKLVEANSDFQKIEIFDSYTYGRVLSLDGIVQVTERDESAYSEMLVHPAVNAVINPKCVLIVGGGDGAVAEEVLKHKNISRIDLVDIDSEVINYSKKYLKKINNGSLNNKKVKIFEMDASYYIQNTKVKYDVIIADRPDPVGAGKNLFKSNFYKNIRKALSQKGVAVFQSGVPFLQKKELTEVIKNTKKYFKFSGIILTVVPSYIGGYMALVWVSKNTDLKISKIKNPRIKTNYYNYDICKASFYLPNFIKKM